MTTPTIDPQQATEDGAKQDVAQVEPELSPEELAQQQAQEQERTARRKAQRLPYVLTVGTSAVGMAAWGVGEVASTAGVSPLLTTAATAALSAASGLVWLRVSREKIEQRWQQAARNAVIGAVSLATLDSWCGATWGTLAATVVAEATLGMTWRRQFDTPLAHIPADEVQARGGWRMLLPWRKRDVDTADVTEAEPPPSNEGPVVVVSDEIDDLICDVTARWPRYISCPNGPMAQTKLANPERRNGGARFVIETVPGTAQYSDLSSALGRVAAGLERSAGDLRLKPYPGNEGKAYLYVSAGDSLVSLTFDGPQYNNGTIPLGTDGTGEKELSVVIKDDTGVHPFLVTGEPRSGKTHSGLLPIVMGLKSSGEWLIVYCDGDPAGGSSPMLNQLSDSRPGKGPEDVYKQLLAIEETLYVRGLLKSTLTEDAYGRPIPMVDPESQRPASKILPCPAYPGIAWIMDEFYKLARDRWLKSMGFIDRVEQVVRLGPKYGVAVGVATHSILAPDYGDSTPLRAMLGARNGVAFRNMNRSEVGVLAGVEVKPYKLPTGGGYFYLAEGGNMQKARGGEIKDLTPWLHALTGAQADQDTGQVLAALEGGENFDPIEAARDARAALTEWRERKAAGEAGGTVAPDPYAQYGDMADLHRLLDDMPTLTLIQGDGEEPLSITQLKMLAALPGKNAYIAKRVGVSVSYVEKQMPKLVATGHAVQPEKYGPYQRTPAGDKAVTDATGELDAEADRELAEDEELDQLAN